jgi:succinate dehydrogenase / fumarate reductase cytochrome b subunit
MNRLKALYASTIGKKFVAAITGLILLGFLLGHVAGNLKVFTGATAEGVPHIDEYGHFLRVAGEPMIPAGAVLWGARFVLLASVILHVLVVVQLAMLSAEARPMNYVKSKKRAASLPALWMMFSGLLILFFIIFHILHFTTGTIQLGTFEHGYIYNNLESSFTKPIVAGAYVLVMIVLGFHLNHGVWSMFQTLGLDNPDRNKFLRMLATGRPLPSSSDSSPFQFRSCSE